MNRRYVFQMRKVAKLSTGIFGKPPGKIKRWVKNNPYLCIALGGFIEIVLIFVVIYLFDSQNIPTSNGWVSEADSKLWLDRLVGYAGAAAGAFVGFIATILAVRITIDNQERVRREDNAKAVLPLLKVCADNGAKSCDLEATISRSLDKSRGRFSECFTNGRLGLSVENIGQRELYNLRIVPVGNEFFNGPVEGSDVLPILYKGETARVGIKIKAKGAKHEVNFIDVNSIFLFESSRMRALFDDCYGNHYEQDFSVDISYDPENSSNKNLIFAMSEVENCKVISAPKQVRYGESLL